MYPSTLILDNITTTPISKIKIDPYYFDPTLYKANDLGFVTTSWVKLSLIEFGSLNRTVREGNFFSSFKTKSGAGQFGINTAIAAAGYATDYLGGLEGAQFDIPFTGTQLSEKFFSVLLFNVGVNISRDPVVITSPVNGLNGTFKQVYQSGDAKIELSGTLSSNVEWHSDTASQRALDNLSKVNKPLYIQSPELNSVYGIRKVVLTGYRIGTNSRYPNLREFTISLLSEPDDTIFEEIKVKTE